jgi:alpha-ribazole phosphatase/probable phosphoglycerate mutase
VVGHGALFRMLLLPLIKIPRTNVFWKMKMDNCSLSGIGIDKKSRAFIVFFNDTIHLRTNMDCIKDIPLPW